MTSSAVTASQQHYVMACMRPNFSQSIDTSRPHTLLTENMKRSGTLEYRYDDTLETVLVPNVWYNQTWQVRVEAVRFDATRADEQAQKYEKNPPYGMTAQMAADIARRYRERAVRIRAEADRMAAAAKVAHPVHASQMRLDYGPAVF